jgi:hypothetical protein
VLARTTRNLTDRPAVKVDQIFSGYQECQMIGADVVPETSVIFNQLTLLKAGFEFIYTTEECQLIFWGGIM